MEFVESGDSFFGSNHNSHHLLHKPRTSARRSEMDERRVHGDQSFQNMPHRETQLPYRREAEMEMYENVNPNRVSGGGEHYPKPFSYEKGFKETSFSKTGPIVERTNSSNSQSRPPVPLKPAIKHSSRYDTNNKASGQDTNHLHQTSTETKTYDAGYHGEMAYNR